MLHIALQKAFDKLHILLQSRLLLTLATAFCLGLLVSYSLDLDAKPIAITTAILLSITLLCQLSGRYPKAAIGSLLLYAACIGLFLGLTAQKQLQAFSPQTGQTVTVEGKLIGNPLYGAADKKTRLLLEVSSVNGDPYQGAALYVYADLQGTIPPNSLLRACGTIVDPEPASNQNAFDYRQYLRRQGVAASLYAEEVDGLTLLQKSSGFSFWAVGGFLTQKLNLALAYLPEDTAALVKGVFLGDKTGLDYQTKQSLSLSGSLHAFAVSGLHVGFIVALGCALAGSAYRRRWLRLILSLALLALYLSMTGPVPSVLRAAIMAATLLLGQALLQKADGLTSLAIAALLCLIYKPLWLTDAGFLLSFGAAASLLLLLPTLQKLLPPLPKPIFDTVSVSMTASLGVTPLISYYFYHITWLGWLLSPLVIVAAGVTVVTAFCSTLLACFSPAIAAWPLTAAGWLMGFTADAADWFCTLPAIFSLSGAVALPLVAGFYLLLLAVPPLVNRGLRKLAVSLLLTLICALALLPSLLAPVQTQSFPLQTPLTQVTFLDVGQGDCALVQLPQGAVLLIDGGGKENSPGSVGENILLPYLKSQKIDHIDLMINSHPHSDHLDGLLTVLDQLPVTVLLCAQAAPDTAQQQLLLDKAAKQGTEVLYLAAGDRYTVEDALLQVYSPPADSSWEQDINGGSLLFELSIGKIDFLFTGDAEAPELRQAAELYDLEAEIVKLPHHGSADGYAEEFYEDTQAKTAIISVGENNRYGHPTDRVLAYWQEHGQVYRTDQNGAVNICTDGQTYTVQCYSDPP